MVRPTGFECNDEEAVAAIEDAFGKVIVIEYEILDEVIIEMPSLYPRDLPHMLATVLVSIIRYHNAGNNVDFLVRSLLLYFNTEDIAIEYNEVMRRVFGPDSGRESLLGEDDVLIKAALEQWKTFDDRQCRAVLCWISCVMKWTDFGLEPDEQDYDKASRYWLERIRWQPQS